MNKFWDSKQTINRHYDQFSLKSNYGSRSQIQYINYPISVITTSTITKIPVCVILLRVGILVFWVV